MSQNMTPRSSLRSIDAEIADAIAAEGRRQQEYVDLIASENHCEGAVLEAMGSVLTDKYAEGYPGARWYGGCEAVDAVERLAIERACGLFGAEHANVQPHSGSQANMAVYMAMLSPGAKVLGMALADGGHLTHGHPRNFSGLLYEVVSYGISGEGQIDYDQVRSLAITHNPALIIAGASSYSRTIDFEAFRQIADEVGAYLLADISHIAGLVACGLHPSPLPHAHFVTTTTHKTLRGPRGAIILCQEKYADRIDSAVFPGMQGGPMMHVIAAKAVALKRAAEPEFRLYQQKVLDNARAMAAALSERGFSIVFGGTDNHMFLLDLRERDFSGRQAAEWLALAHITVNKNAVPGDRRKPFDASGIRLGSPAVTTRGMGPDEMRALAGWIADILNAPDPEAAAPQIRPRVADLCARYGIRR